MKRLLMIVLALALLLSCSLPAFAEYRSGKERPMEALEGAYGEPESIRYDGTAYVSPFYLSRPVTGCNNVTLTLSGNLLSGYCGGNYYLYVKDPNGEWHHTAAFRFEQDMAKGDPYTFTLNLDKKETFVAIAIWPADKGMDFSIEFDYTLRVKPAFITDYSDAIPAPFFTPCATEQPITATHFSIPEYSVPSGPKS